MDETGMQVRVSWIKAEELREDVSWQRELTKICQAWCQLLWLSTEPLSPVFWVWVCGGSCLQQGCRNSSHHWLHFCLASWPVLLDLVRAVSFQQGTRSCSYLFIHFFYVVCFNVSSLGLIYNIITFLQIVRTYNLSTDTMGDKRIRITLCYLNPCEVAIGRNKSWVFLSLFRSLLFKFLVFLLSIHCVGFVQSFSLAFHWELYIT